MHHTAAHCSTLQHSATLCYTQQKFASHYSTLQHTAPRCIAAHCNKLQHNAMHRITLQHIAKNILPAALHHSTLKQTAREA